MSSITIPDGNVDEWLDELKPYQKNTLRQFLEAREPEEAAKLWLGSTGSPNIIPFGGTPNSKPFWDRFTKEFRRFICDDEAYKEEKEALQIESPVTKALLISVVSAALCATLGLAATLLAPAVTLMLFVIGKMGVNAYCSYEG